MVNRVEPFFFAPQSDRWLSLFRIGLGIAVLLYCAAAHPAWQATFHSAGKALPPRRISETIVRLQSPAIPTLEWLVKLGGHLGLSETMVITSVWWLLLLVSALLVIGLFCRAAAMTGWFLHLVAIKSGDIFSYGADNFLTIGLFYLMLSPSPDAFALEQKLWDFRSRRGWQIGFFRRVLQVHLCVIYGFSGLQKFLGADWWNGLNLWRALTRPPFDVIDPLFLARWGFFLAPVGIAICLLELLYPLMIWPKQTRLLWLVAVCMMHCAIAVTMAMYQFGFIMIVLNVAAFAPFSQRKAGVVSSEPAAPCDTVFGSTLGPATSE